jgi:hypothetical protein
MTVGLPLAVSRRCTANLNKRRIVLRLPAAQLPWDSATVSRCPKFGNRWGATATNEIPFLGKQNSALRLPKSRLEIECGRLPIEVINQWMDLYIRIVWVRFLGDPITIVLKTIVIWEWEFGRLIQTVLHEWLVGLPWRVVRLLKATNGQYKVKRKPPLAFSFFHWNRIRAFERSLATSRLHFLPRFGELPTIRNLNLKYCSVAFFRILSWLAFPI